MSRIGLEYIELSIYVQVRITLLCRVQSMVCMYKTFFTIQY